LTDETDSHWRADKESGNMKLDRILLAVDFSEPSVRAAEWAVRELAPEAAFTLCYSLDVARAPDFLRDVLPVAAESESGLRADAEAHLAELAATLGAGRFSTEVVAGRPADAITDAARRHDADMILLGAHGQRYTEWDAIGSTAEQAVRCSTVPVLVVRGRPEGVARVLVSVDGSEFTPRVIAWAEFLRQRFGARLEVLHVLDFGLYGTVRKARSPEAVGHLEGDAAAATRAWLEAQLLAAGVSMDNVDLRIEFGDPKYEIVNAAVQTQADLVVMGSRGASRVGTAQLGGNAASVLRGTRVPLCVVTELDEKPCA
jgi:nucleotide-binding universal stress UspA family protein